MRLISSIRSLLPWLPALVLALIALDAAPRAWAQVFPRDPVDELRRVLRAPVRDPATRQRELTKRLSALHTIGEIRRALALQEWRDEDPDEKIAEVDAPLRADLAKRFAERIRAALTSNDPAAQLGAADMLAETGVTARGVQTRSGLTQAFGPDLVALIRKGNPAVQEAAARAIGVTNANPEVVLPALAELLQSPNVNQRRAAAEALDNIIKTLAQLAGRTRSAVGVEATRGELVNAAQAVLPVAGKGLADADPVVRRECIEAIEEAASALSRSIDARTIDEIIDADDYRRQVEEEQRELKPLIEALAAVAPATARALRDPDTRIRQLAAEALEEMGLARLLLQRRLRDASGAPPRENGQVKGGKPAALTVALASQAQPTVKDLLLEALKEALPALADALHDPDPQVRLQALDTLEEMGPAVASIVGAVIRATEDPDLFVRWAAVRVLGKMGPVNVAASVPALARRLCDTDLNVDLAAANALESYGPAARGAVPALIARLDAPDAELRIALIDALMGIGMESAPAIPALTQLLGDSDARVRTAAAQALGRFGPLAREAVPALERTLNDSSAEVRRAASDALLSVVQPAEK